MHSLRLLLVVVLLFVVGRLAPAQPARPGEDLLDWTIQVVGPNGPVEAAQVVAWETEKAVETAGGPRVGIFQQAEGRASRGLRMANTGANGEVRFQAHAAAFQQVMVRAQPFAVALQLNVRASAEPLRITLTPGKPQAGQVVDDAGVGVANARIIFTPVYKPGGLETSNGLDENLRVARTDKSGQFTLYDLPAPTADMPTFGLLVDARGYHPVCVEAKLDAAGQFKVKLPRLGVIAVQIETRGRAVEFDSRDLAVSAVPIGTIMVPDALVMMSDNQARGILEQVWVNAAGQALGTDGQPDAFFDRPGTGVVALAERERLRRYSVHLNPGEYQVAVTHPDYRDSRSFEIGNAALCMPDRIQATPRTKWGPQVDMFVIPAAAGLAKTSWRQRSIWANRSRLVFPEPCHGRRLPCLPPSLPGLMICNPLHATFMGPL